MPSVASNLSAMERLVLFLVLLFLQSVLGHPQERQMFYRKTTTQDPVSAFFSSCDLRTAHCVRSEDCRNGNILNEGRCSVIGHVCCKKENTAVVFPDHTSARPVITTTKTATSSTTTTPRTRTTTTKPKTKKPTRTTTTTTTEEPITGWLHADCGVRQSSTSHEIDMRDSERGEFPWNVEIFSKFENDFGFQQNVFHCGGTLIDDFVVVTSANCENLRSSTELFISAGVWNLNDLEDNRQIRKVAKIIKHPRFEQGSRIASIALLILDDQVDFSQRVNRICIPEVDTDFSTSMCFVTGWGGTPNSNQTIRPYMKVVEMQLLEHSMCTKDMRRTLPKYELHESFQCANEESANHLCPFDVGSPLFCTIPGRQQQFYQVGIFVWNQFVHRNMACRDGYGVVNLFVKMQQFRHWIDKELEKLGRNRNIYIPQPEDDDEDQPEL
ncbi:serine protease 55 [Aedes aegypti]|uniref:Peptidase S1 domain-containing protein n=2 Tax=Aedes aegypti TaxID=7159 RepID=A0A903VBU1_AEDAE|nr:serine protease 55 [Aedes aegypti]